MCGKDSLKCSKPYLEVCHPLEKKEKGECPTLISGSKLLLPPHPFDTSILITMPAHYRKYGSRKGSRDLCMWGRRCAQLQAPC